MTDCPVFDAPPRVPQLGTDDVHVWRCGQQPTADAVRQFLQLLSEQERCRAARFHFEEHRARFIARRGMLRVVLGRYLACEPDCLELRGDANGKPWVVPPPGRSPIHFNVSHSAGLALIAVARFPGVGVDLEEVRELPGLEGIASRFFPPAERAAFRSLPAREQRAGFFRGWTRTEAYVKAVGAGIALLDHPGSEDAAPAGRSRWSLHSFSPAEGYAAALAVPRRSVTITQFTWPASTAGCTA